MISVCMATFNGEKHIKEQVESILSQLSFVDELIVSDDGSTDKTLDIIESFHDNRIRVLHHSPVEGSAFKKATSNFENALRHAKGEYIFLSDQDDIWHNDKIVKCMKVLDKHLCVQHTRNCFAEDANCVFPPKRRIAHTLFENILFLPSCFSGCCLAFNRKILDLVLPIPASVNVHDAWIGCLAFLSKDLVSLNEDLIDYRVNIDTVSYGKSTNSFLNKIKYRINLFIQIVKRFYFRIK